MVEKIAWTLDVTVSAGPKYYESRQLKVEAYDNITAVVPGDAPAVSVDVQPSSTPTDVTFMFIRSSVYSASLTYSVPGGVSNVPLDEPQLLAGGGVALLGAAPRTLEFTNGLGAGNSAEVTIFVGRKAT